MAGVTRETLQNHMNAQVETCPRDLLRRFGSGSFPDGEASLAVGEGSLMEEVELSLGLSLGGTFGVEPTNKGLLRASSVAAFSFFPKKEEVEEGKEPVVAAHVLMRTCSLPVETAEAQRKRKEMQSLRRLEAKRKREEKRGLRPKTEDSYGCGDAQQMEGFVLPRTATTGPFDPIMDGAVCPPSSSLLPRRRRDEQHNHSRRSPPIPGWLPMKQLSSAGAQGGGCSTSSSEYDCLPMQGPDISRLSRSSNPEAKSPQSIISSMKQTDENAAVFTTDKGTREKSVSARLKKSCMGRNGSREMARSMMEEMPCVSTKGNGPNGKRIEGFLCKYAKGEDVRIMCVCHGSFLSPAEFVKHAGGGDVEFPLKHILVYPSQQTFL